MKPKQVKAEIDKILDKAIETLSFADFVRLQTHDYTRAIKFFRRDRPSPHTKPSVLTAIRYAVAEQYAVARGWEFEWKDDEPGWDSLWEDVRNKEITEEQAKAVKEILYLVLKDENGDTLDSTSDVRDASQAEGREIEAELAWLAMR